MPPSLADIKKGTKIAYAGFGPGRVVAVHGRGDKKIASIEIPHQQLAVDLPVAHALANGRLRPLVSERTAKTLLKISDKGAESLPDSWSLRRDQVQEKVKANAPSSWRQLVADYLHFIAGGGTLSVSDHDLLDQALSLIAAEAAYVLGRDYDEVHTELRAQWRACANAARPPAA